VTPLDEREVHDFLLAAKTVKRPAAMRWVRVTQDHLRASFHMEVDSVSVGELSIVHTSALPRHYNLNLDLQGETVCMWHIRDFGKHRNKNCPGGFPGRVKNRPHQHVWVAGRATDCVKEIEGLDGQSPQETLALFCERLSIEFGPPYAPPIIADQLVMPFEEES
jgi:hypothetical protein